MSGRPGQDAAIETLQASVYQIPTDAPEADGTLAWSTTTLVVAEARAGALDPHGGVLRSDQSRPGLGLEFKQADAENFRVS